MYGLVYDDNKHFVAKVPSVYFVNIWAKVNIYTLGLNL